MVTIDTTRVAKELDAARAFACEHGLLDDLEMNLARLASIGPEGRCCSQRRDAHPVPYNLRSFRRVARGAASAAPRAPAATSRPTMNSSAVFLFTCCSHCCGTSDLTPSREPVVNCRCVHLTITYISMAAMIGHAAWGGT
jgi:hypothetical protein